MSVDGDDTDYAAMAAKAAAVAARKKLPLRQRIREFLVTPTSPDSTFRRAIDINIMILVVFQAYYVPFVVAFSEGLPKSVDLAVDIIFMADVVMNFNLSYRPYANADLITDRKKIAINYLKCWFWIDLVSSVPFDLLSEQLATQSLEDASDLAKEGDGKALAAANLFKTLRIPKLLRLLKVMRILKIFRLAEMRPELMWYLQYSRNANVINLFKIIIYIMTFVHCSACIFYLVLGSSPEYVEGDTSWMALQECEGFTNSQYQDKLFLSEQSAVCQNETALPSQKSEAGCFQDGDLYESCSDTLVWERYTTSFYFSMLLIMGEEINPTSVGEKIFATVIILIGSIVVAIIYGSVSMYINNFTANVTAYQRKMEYLFESMRHLQLPLNLRKRILLYYGHIWKEYQSLDGNINGFTGELSKQLSSEVYLYLRTNLILSVPFLSQCSPEVVQQLVLRLKSEVFLPSDYIVHKGAPGNEMYLISKGVCEVTITDMKTAAEQREEEEKKAAMVKKRGRRRSSTSDVLTGAMSNFTDFIQQRNAKIAKEKEILLRAPETEEGTAIPKTRKSYRKQMNDNNPLKRISGPMRRVSASFKPGGGGGGGGGGSGGENAGKSSDANDESVPSPLKIITEQGESTQNDNGSPKPLKSPEEIAAMTPKERELFIKNALVANAESKRKPLIDPLKNAVFHHEKVVKELVEGEYFGEICLVLNTTRTCNVRAKR